jgi:hypothetical protein
MGPRGSPPAVKYLCCEADTSSLSNVEIRMSGAIPPYTPCPDVLQRDKFVFTFAVL